MINEVNYPNLAYLVDMQLSVFPEHEEYLARRFEGSPDDELVIAEDLALKARLIVGDRLKSVCESYKWLSGEIIEEEFYFRRNGKYRLSSFEEAYRQIYANEVYMTRYVEGILLSQIWWANHCATIKYFREQFITGNPPGFSHLEVGPGHGLFLFYASESDNCGSITGWDVSSASLKSTTECLRAMGVTKQITLREVNLLDAPDETFDSITFSEVLEHLEDPLGALKILHRLLKPGGRIMINAPVNSPAPDHIYLFNTPEEVIDMIIEAGFEIEKFMFSTVSGDSLERSRKLKSTISAVVIATRR
jgi:ubiquinone/menaquinone biosynthesis C-methylase UbiE